jgi:hypothetical protein
VNRHEFFAALFPDPTSFIHLKVLKLDADGKIKSTGFYMYAQPLEHVDIENFIEKYADKELYFGVASRLHAKEIHARAEAGEGTGDAKIGDCDKFYCLYGDVDFKTVPRAEADRILNEMPVPPDIIVMSGGGYHVYWLLAEPLDARAAHPWLKRLQAYVKSDDVADPTRILRVPGTVNHKPGRGPVEIVKADAAKRHELSEFDFLPHVAGEVAPDTREHIEGDCPGAELVIEAFRTRGLLGAEVSPGKINVTCPWASSHRESSGSPVLYVNDVSGPGFSCLSEGCAKSNGGVKRDIGDVYREFDIVTDVAFVKLEARQEKNEDLGGERYHDLPNAERLAVDADGSVLYADAMKDQFFIYDGQRFVLSPRMALTKYVKPVIQRLYAEAKIAELQRDETWSACAVPVPRASNLGTASTRHWIS